VIRPEVTTGHGRQKALRARAPEERKENAFGWVVVLWLVAVAVLLLLEGVVAELEESFKCEVERDGEWTEMVSREREDGAWSMLMEDG